MLPDKYAEVVRGLEPPINVHVPPGLTHMDMLHMPAAIEGIAAAFKDNVPAN
jgi:hypothetical protein